MTHTAIATGTSSPALVSELGMPGAVPPGRPGNPDSDEDWFVTDWMDTTRAQEALQFQHYSWPDMMAELREEFGWKRYPAKLIAPIARAVMKRRGGVLEGAGHLRRSVGRDPRQTGRSLMGSAKRPPLTT